jgi:hypothetical protein
MSDARIFPASGNGFNSQSLSGPSCKNLCAGDVRSGGGVPLAGSPSPPWLGFSATMGFIYFSHS